MNNSKLQCFVCRLCLAEGMAAITMLREIFHSLFTLIAKFRNAKFRNAHWKKSKQTQNTATSGQIPTQFQHFRSEHFYVSKQLMLPHQLFKMTYVMSSTSGILLLPVTAFLFNFSSAGNSPLAELYLG